MTISLPLACLLSLAPFDDSCATASLTTVTSGAYTSSPNRSLGPGDLADYYRMVIQPGNSAEIGLLFSHANGNLDLRLWNHDCTVLLVSSLSTDDDELAYWSNPTNGPVEIVAEAFLASTVTSDVIYDFTRQGFFETCDFDDLFESNDSCATAWPLPFTDFDLDHLTITPGDDDYFTFTVPPYREQYVEVLHANAVADLDAQLIADDCVSVLETSSTQGWERLRLRNLTLVPKTFTVRVYRVGATSGCSPYILRRTAGLGVDFCTAEANSTGEPTLILAYGSSSFSANGLRLYATPTPWESFGLFIFATDNAQVPLGNGTLCVGPTIQRGPVLQSTPNYLEWNVDYDEFAGSAVPFSAGSTYHFQLWFRDTPISGVNFGLSNGYSVLLEP